MKNITLIIACILLALQPVFAQNKNYNGDVTFIKHEEEGTITLQAYGISRAEALKNAFNILLFKGVPGSNQSIPMVPNEMAAKQQYADYFKKLLEGNYANNFIAYLNGQDNDVAASKKMSNHSRIKIVTRPFEIKINYVALRKDLEQNGIIRKFGF